MPRPRRPGILIPEGRGGNKRVAVKRFASGTTIIDLQIFNFHVKQELPTKYGVSLNQSEFGAVPDFLQTT